MYISLLISFCCLWDLCDCRGLQ